MIKDDLISKIQERFQKEFPDAWLVDTRKLPTDSVDAAVVSVFKRGCTTHHGAYVISNENKIDRAVEVMRKHYEADFPPID